MICQQKEQRVDRINSTGKQLIWGVRVGLQAILQEIIVYLVGGLGGHFLQVFIEKTFERWLEFLRLSPAFGPSVRQKSLARFFLGNAGR